MAFSGTKSSFTIDHNKSSHTERSQQKQNSRLKLFERNRAFSFVEKNFEFIKVKTNDISAFTVYDESNSRNS